MIVYGIDPYICDISIVPKNRHTVQQYIIKVGYILETFIF